MSTYTQKELLNIFFKILILNYNQNSISYTSNFTRIDFVTFYDAYSITLFFEIRNYLKKMIIFFK